MGRSVPRRQALPGGDLWGLRLVWLLAASLSMAACIAPNGGGTTTSADPFEERVAAGEALCGALWTHIKAIGKAFNEGAGDVATIERSQDRRARWLAVLDEMRSLNDSLADEVGKLDQPRLEPMVVDIVAGVERANSELDDLSELIADTPELDEERHQRRTSQLIVRIEKVVDVVKPEMADYEDADLVAAWRTVPACQHAVKDVDDGTPRSNG